MALPAKPKKDSLQKTAGRDFFAYHDEGDLRPDNSDICIYVREAVRAHFEK